MTEYKYYLASQKWSNSINEYKFCWGSQKAGLQDQFWVSQVDAKFAESSDDWSRLQMQTASYPYDSTDVTLVHEDELQFWRTKYFWQHRVLKEEHSPTHFSEDWLIQSSEKWQIFMCPLIKSINAQQNMYSIQKKNSSGIRFEKITRIRIWIIFGPKFLDEYEYYSDPNFWTNTNTNNIRTKIFGRIRIRIIFGSQFVAEYEYEYLLFE